MKITNIKITNFRLLEDIYLSVEDDITLIIGRNNSGKTSFFEAIKMFTGKSEEDISFEDFSQSCYLKFREILALYESMSTEGVNEEEKEKIEEEIIQNTPAISLQIEIEYDKKVDSIVNLSQFITDLDPDRNDAIIQIIYSPKNTLGMFKSYINREDSTEELIPFLHKNIKEYYQLRCYALDTINNSNYKREIEGNYRDKIKRVVSFEDIKALRILDDKKGDRNNTLALGFSNYYNQRDEASEDVLDLEKVLTEVEETLKGKYKIVLAKIIKSLKKFGANTPITIPDINIDSSFNSEDVIKRNIKYFYKQDEIDLPESYNGLGYSNLIYMILELASFVEKFKNAKKEKLSEFLTVLIEEPEAHMHPQMQQVFISNVNGILEEARKEGVSVQLILTTHSSHVISEAGMDNDKGFNRIRYFNRKDNKIIAQDFNELKIIDDKKTFRFLKQYLTLHKCDLFFADKAVLIEGVTERMLLPQMIQKVAPDLQNEYVATLEIGGAYTHKFLELLSFISIKTLIITDIDSKVEGGEKCPVNNGENDEVTSNGTLIQWLPKMTKISDLITATDEQKIEEHLIRVAYQIMEAEGGETGRSFEESFIIKNKDLINGTTSIKEADGSIKDVKNKNQFSKFKKVTTENLNAKSNYDLAPSSSKSKTNFAFDVMTFEEDIYGKWSVPKYIKEGLEWLAGMCVFIPKEK
ncbi:AAA family ATPase [uncultured Dokdonia sp.]|uniref:ATP-dependent nuclease n=1 Tax=uncultured Dokdonia sp. TaxID=575653 RepID=UPI00260E11F0|nr:AAA family ATPase [uncultured Dokdonia sp.]